MLKYLLGQENLTVSEGEADELILDGDTVVGVVCKGEKI